MSVRTIVFAIGYVAMASTTLAQQREPIAPFVADVHVTSSGLPVAEGWTPLVPTNTVLPSRGLGLEIGAHVNVLRARSFALGVGATWMTARGSSAPPDPEEGTTNPATVPDVTTRVTSLAPQLSLNFGHSLGWSYLSAGLGRARVKSEAALPSGTTTFTPRDSDWVKTLNFGGGARWFINDHVGIGFDVRWHKLSVVPASSTHPGAGRASLLVAGAGLVLK